MRPVLQYTVVPLTSELADELEAAASCALVGDGSCSAANCKMSCFAGEACADGRAPDTRLSSLLYSKHAFVARTNDATPRFAGCVGASDAKSALSIFPHMLVGPGDLLLSTLCVDSHFRGDGLGRQLVDAVLALHAPKTYLLVRRISDEHVARLRATYDRLNFCECGKCDRYLLMQHRPPSPADPSKTSALVRRIQTALAG